MCISFLLHSDELALKMTCDSTDPYVFSTDTLPSDRRFLSPLVNGTLGWRVFGEVMHKAGVYNGELGFCHRADLPCPLAVTMRTSEGKHTYSLDTRNGMYRKCATPTPIRLSLDKKIQRKQPHRHCQPTARRSCI